MNWKEIKEKYPKAYEKIKGEYGVTYKTPNESWTDMEGICNCLLYCFFDENEIYVQVIVGYNMDTYWWCYQITQFLKTMASHDHYNGFNTRTEAEEAAFTKAFEILEKKL